LEETTNHTPDTQEDIQDEEEDISDNGNMEGSNDMETDESPQSSLRKEMEENINK